MTTSPETPASSLPEYESNPFIARLPPLQSQRQLSDALAARPEYHVQERGYAASLRKHCIMRLGRYFEPLERQIQLADRFGMLLRQGYIGRNPLTHDYIRHLQNGAERIEAKSLTISTRHPVENTATSFALAGCSGIGTRGLPSSSVSTSSRRWIGWSAPTISIGTAAAARAWTR